MKIFPSFQTTLKSPLSKVEVMEILSSNIAPRTGLSFPSSKKNKTKLFEGQLTNSTFNIQLAIDYRNSFIPQIKGSIDERNNYTEIKISLELHKMIKIFMTIWITFIAISLIATSYSFANGNTNIINIIIPLSMLIFGIALVYWGFNNEKGNSVKILSNLIQAKIKNA